MRVGARDSGGGEYAGEETEIFEGKYGGDVADDTDYEGCFSGFPAVGAAHPEADEIVDGHEDNYQKDIYGFAPAIEEEGENHQGDVSPGEGGTLVALLPVPVGEGGEHVEEHERREKNEKEKEVGKNHWRDYCSRLTIVGK